MSDIAIVIPCYNQGPYLKATLESVGRSSIGKGLEVIIINDGSNDPTTIRELSSLQDSKDLNVKIISTENQGLSAARNTGVKASDSEYIVFLDADDLLTEGTIDKRIEFLKKNGLDAVVTDYVFCNEEQNITWKPSSPTISEHDFNFYAISRFWERGVSIPIHCALFRKELLLDISFQKELKAKEDWYFWLELFDKNYKIKHLQHIGAIYRMHSSNMTRNNCEMGVRLLQASMLASRNFEKFDTNSILSSKLHFREFYLNFFWQKHLNRLPENYFYLFFKELSK